MIAFLFCACSTTPSSISPLLQLPLPSLQKSISLQICLPICLCLSVPLCVFLNFTDPQFETTVLSANAGFLFRFFPAQLQHAKEGEEAPIGEELLQTFFCFFCFFPMMMLLLLLFFPPWISIPFFFFFFFFFQFLFLENHHHHHLRLQFLLFTISVILRIGGSSVNYNIKFSVTLKAFLAWDLFFSSFSFLPQVLPLTSTYVCTSLSVSVGGCVGVWVCGCVGVCFSLCLSFTSNLQSQKELKRASLSALLCVPDFCPSLLLSLYLSLFLICLFFRPHEKKEKLFGAAET